MPDSELNHKKVFARRHRRELDAVTGSAALKLLREYYNHVAPAATLQQHCPQQTRLLVRTTNGRLAMPTTR
jgi:hypothetical protein